MSSFDGLDILFAVWAFFFQIVFVIRFAVRKRFFESYALRFGWIVYALSIPAAAISLVLLVGGKLWSFWLGGFLFLVYAAYGYWVDYVRRIPWARRSCQSQPLD
jgi:Gpi18-like mannosyltransferase